MEMLNTHCSKTPFSLRTRMGRSQGRGNKENHIRPHGHKSVIDPNLEELNLYQGQRHIQLAQIIHAKLGQGEEKK